MTDCTNSAEQKMGALNPFVLTLVQQLLTYVVSHADEIVEAILALFDGDTPEEVQVAADEYKNQPNEQTLERLVKAVESTTEVKEKEIAMTIVNHADVGVPEGD